jgi:glycosyltransferase involved in cell wall biosynthesis
MAAAIRVHPALEVYVGAESVARERWGIEHDQALVTATTPQVTVIMPCLNEETTVGRCVRKARDWFRSEGIPGEVIVVDNGSTDRSRALAIAAGARVIDEEERGYGAALMRGIDEARSEFLVMGDCDDTYDFSDMSALVAPLRAGADMVVGNRYAGIQPGAMTWSHRYIGTPAISFMLRLFTGAALKDSQCGLRAFTRDAYRRMDVKTPGMEFASEMILKAARKDMRVVEVPINYYPREEESEAKLRTFRDGWRHLRFLVLATPNHLFTIPGAALTIAGIALLALSLAGPSSTVNVGSFSWQPVFAAPILTVLGVNGLIFGGIARLATTARGLTPEDLTYRLARRTFTFEFAVIGAGVLLGLGAGLDVGMALNAASNHLAVAALAQTLLLLGGNLLLCGSLAAIMNDRL